MNESAPANDWRRRTSTRVAVCLLSWWACGASYAVDFPSLPLQTGTSQVPPNVLFILDDSLSMTSSGGNALDTRLVWCTPGACPNQPQMGDADSKGLGAPYTKNPLSYNPAIEYKPWAYANNTDTSVLDRGNASYTSASNDLQLYTGGAGSINLSSTVQTYYVPKPNTTQTDRRNYYRYQILTGTPGKVVRAEWTNTNNSPSMSAGSNWNNELANAARWTNGGGANSASTTRRTYTVPAGATRVVIATSGTLGNSRDPGIYVNVGAAAFPNRSTPTYSVNAAGGNTHETLTIDNPTVGALLQIGVFNHGTSNISTTGFNITVTYTTTTEIPLGCTLGSNWGWKNCVDVSDGSDLATTKVQAVGDEKQNYANWYQYHRTRMKVAKAGGSEAFAALDENYRVGLMGLYPSGTYQQVAGGSTGGAAPTAANPGNLNNIIPVGTNGGLFVGANRQTWFNRFHAMSGKQYTPLRQALDAAGKYFSNERAYESKVGSADSTYLACRQNFTILTTDGYWNNWDGDDDPDSNYEGDKISGDEEDGLLITGPNNDDYQYEREAPYFYDVANSDRDDETTLADIAMHYWKTDLRTADGSHAGSSVNKVPTSDSNPAFWQHMVTFGVGLGVRGKLTDAEVELAMTNGPGAYWPAPVHAENATENPENVDDLRHAALNGRGSFVNANDSTEFANGIRDALGRISERRGSASNVLANSTSISTESFIYQATYTAGAWRGELLAYPISTEGLAEADWLAGERMAAWGDRNIFTASDATTGETFPTTDQLSDLSTPANTLLGDSTKNTELAQYLKGDGSLEKRNGGVLRNRAVPGPVAKTFLPRVLGDIVDSSPFYVADTQTVFVGANDGMLHAFDASNSDPNADNTSGGGTERFAYVPLGVSMSQMAELADPLYGTNTATKPHRFFVDGPIVVSSRARTPGKNYLVGALGRGGRDVYGLNVTNPGSFDADDVLWDRTGAPDDNMGNVISEPLISKLNNNVTAAVVANGPNSVTGTASLFILNLDTGATIHEFDTGTTDNGLSAPRAVDVNADGKVDFFFAGDLLGNLWRFNVSSDDTSEWAYNKVFMARSAANAVQPISSAPGVARDPSNGNIWVFFGTGRYMTSDDQSSVATQTYYGIMVGTAGTTGTNWLRANLDERTIQVIDLEGRRAFEPAETGIEAGKNGWYIDLDDPSGTGERVISAPLLYNNILVFSSIVPPDADTVNGCDAGGTGYVNALDAFSGTGLTAQFFTNVPLIEDGDDELPVGSLPINAGMPTAPIIIGDQLVVGDSSGGKPTDETVNAPGGTSTKRVSWREVVTQ